MKDRTVSLLAWSLFVVSAGLIAAGIVLGVIASSSPPGFDALGAALILAFPLVGALIASRRPENPIGWIFCTVGISFGLATLATNWSDYAVVNEPGALPFGPFMTWVAVWAWPPGILLIFTFVLLLFPDGRLPSRRWRPVAWLAAVDLVLMVVPVAITAWSIRGPLLTGIEEDAPAAAPGSFKLAYNLQVYGILLMFVLGLAAAASLMLRARHATGDERQQIKWFTFAGAMLVIVVILASPLFHIGDRFQVLAFPLIPIASAVAIFKYRLYDIDLVIKKTLVFGLLGVFISLVYAAIVGGVGALVGSLSSTTLSFVAAAVLAIAFQPARDRARRVADRLVYGKRATPYEVLAEFSGRVGETYSTEDVLPRMAQLLAEGTGATSTTVWLRVGSTVRPAASWPERRDEEVLALEGDALPTLEGEDAVEVRHRGELLGALSVKMPRADPMDPAREKLVADLASQAGLVLRNARLIEELRASRQRLVATQDEERRKIERNLHDGAQQQLVALAVRLRLAESLAERNPTETKAMLSAMQADTGDALQNLRDLARGIYPPLLADKGLTAALEAQARKSSVHTEVLSEGISRYPQETEAAVYFCVLEALNNVAKYSGATGAEVHLEQTDGLLVFEVVDDGAGFDPGVTGYGTGLQGMVDRLDAIEGTLEVRSALGDGTTLVGRVPAQAR